MEERGLMWQRIYVSEDKLLLVGKEHESMYDIYDGKFFMLLQVEGPAIG